MTGFFYFFYVIICRFKYYNDNKYKLYDNLIIYLIQFLS